MGEIIKVEVDAALARRFRRKIMDLYGYKKGSAKVALEDMINRFVVSQKADWGSLKGVLKSRSESVKLQHQVLLKTD